MIQEASRAENWSIFVAISSSAGSLLDNSKIRNRYEDMKIPGTSDLEPNSDLRTSNGLATSSPSYPPSPENADSLFISPGDVNFAKWR